jgi:hypothetical protein
VRVQEESHGANGHSGAEATPEDLTSDYQEGQDEDEQPKAGLPVLPSHCPIALCSQALKTHRFKVISPCGSQAF